MDTDTIEALGTSPLQGRFETIDALTATDQLGRHFGSLDRRGRGRRSGR